MATASGPQVLLTATSVTDSGAVSGPPGGGLDALSYTGDALRELPFLGIS